MHISDFLEAQPKLRLTATCARFNKLTDRIRIRELMPYSKISKVKNKAMFVNLLIDGKHKNKLLPITEFINARHVTVVDEFRGRITYPADMSTMEFNHRAPQFKEIESRMTSVYVGRDYYTNTIKPVNDDNQRFFYVRETDAFANIPRGIFAVELYCETYNKPLILPNGLSELEI